jgi:hypothetical protein
MPYATVQTTPPGALKKEESSPLHEVDTDQYNRDRAQQRDEPAEKHHLAAVTREKILSQLDAPDINPREIAVPQQHRVPQSAARSGIQRYRPQWLRSLPRR